MTTSAAGLAALALLVLVLGYWVPLRVRQRQELADSRTDDRFSTGLRVLAVAAQGRVPAVAAAGESVDASGLILGAGHGRPAPEGRRGHGVSAAALPVGGVMLSVTSDDGGPTAERPAGARRTERGVVERRTVERATGRAARDEAAGNGAAGSGTARSGTARSGTARSGTARSGAPEARTARGPLATHRDQLAVRARRASRRLRVTLLLVAAVAATGSAAVAGALPGWAVLIPAALLVPVLVLGRIAAAAARRADARWAAERRAAERRALQARALAAGGPRAPRNRARVTGRAVRGSSTATQALRRVEPHEVVGATGSRLTESDARSRADVPDDSRTGAQGAAGRAIGDDVTAGAPAQQGAQQGVAQQGSGPSTAPASGAPAPAQTGAADLPRTEPAGSSSSSTGASPTGTPSTGTPSGTPWEARPVPLPTYVTKPAAPRREPRPLSGASPVVSTGWTSSAWQSLDDPGETVGEANTSWSLGTPAVDVPAAPERVTDRERAADLERVSDEALRTPEPRPVTETLGLPLEQILARRRAAG